MVELERERGFLTVRFGSALDGALLEETIAVESECCPFFSFDYDPAQRLLRIGVQRDEQDPALDALAWALDRAHPQAKAAMNRGPRTADRAYMSIMKVRATTPAWLAVVMPWLARTPG